MLLDDNRRLAAAIVAAAFGCLLAALWLAPVPLAAHAVSANVWGWLSAGLAFAGDAALAERLKRFRAAQTQAVLDSPDPAA